MLKKILSSALVFFFILKASSESTYDIEEITTNPGIYYEKQNTIKLERETWQIIIYIDVEEFLNSHKSIVSYKTMLNNCKSRINKGKCNLILGVELFTLKDMDLDRINNEILETINELSKETKEDEILPFTMRRRRASLEVVGDFDRWAFRLMTLKDAEEINEKIDVLARDNKELVKLMNKQSHVVSSAFEELYNVTQAHSSLLMGLEQNINKKWNISGKQKIK